MSLPISFSFSDLIEPVKTLRLLGHDHHSYRSLKDQSTPMSNCASQLPQSDREPCVKALFDLVKELLMIKTVLFLKQLVPISLH